MAKQRNRRATTRRRDKKGGPGSGRRKSCQYCRDKIEQVDYKDVGGAARVRLRAGQDPLAADHRRVPAPPGPDRPGGQARARARAAALRRRGAESRGGRGDRGSRRDEERYRCPRRSCSQDVEQLGERGTVVDVSTGYLRNYLIPRKLAQPATKGALEAAAARAEPRRARRARGDRARAGERRAARPDGADDRAAGRRRRPPVRLRHRPGHRRRDPRGARHQGRQAQGPPRRADPNIGTYMVVVEVADGVTATVKTMVVDQN